MSCNSPNRVFYVGINEETGKKRILYTSRFVDFVYRYHPHDRWKLASNASVDSVDIMKNSGYQVVTDYDDVPCGQCLGCRLDYARQWAARIMEEKKSYPDDTCWFITVTYDDDHLPNKRMIPDKVDSDTGEIYTMKKSNFSSVSKRDHQLFMKRLRKKFDGRTGLPIRFFMSGEYGDQSYRPHYHYIVFGLKLDDLCFYKSNWRGDKLYTSDELSSCWLDDSRRPIGFITIGSVSLDSAGYIARYSLKKRKMTDVDTYKKIGVDPEFILMSRRPGIGKDYFDNHYKDIYYTDKLVLPTKDGATVIKTPKYYDTLLDRIDPDLLDQVKDNRKLKAEMAESFTEEYLPFFGKEKRYQQAERKLSKKASVLKGRNVDG